MRRRPQILISGAGIAGPALAYWLLRAGGQPTIVETAAAPRRGGYMIDFWGSGLKVADQMGIGPALHAIGYQIQELRLVDDTGSAIARLGPDAIRRALGNNFVSVLRSDLANLLMSRAAEEADVLFADSIASLSEDDEGVEVSFRSGANRRFDLVLGADGLHSKVRDLIFNAEANVIRPLGCYVAAFVRHGYPHRDPGAYVSRTRPSRQIARYALRGGDTAFFMIFRAEIAAGLPSASLAEQKALLSEVYRGIGWEGDEIIDALQEVDDLYFDTVDQVRLSSWSHGRAALLGDAAYCPSLLAGEGASLAVTGAYVLAWELRAAGFRHREAFAGYEQRLKRFVDRKQDAARSMGAWFAPRTRAGLVVRNVLTRLAGMPAFSRLLAGGLVADEGSLPPFEAFGAP